MPKHGGQGRKTYGFSGPQIKSERDKAPEGVFPPSAPGAPMGPPPPSMPSVAPKKGD